MDRVTEYLPFSSTVYSLLDNVEGGDQVVIIDSNKDLPENWREQLNEMEGKVKLDEKWESFLDKREQDSENAKEDEDVEDVEEDAKDADDHRQVQVDCVVEILFYNWSDVIKLSDVLGFQILSD